MEPTLFESYKKLNKWIADQAAGIAKAKGVSQKQALNEFADQNQAIMKLHDALYMKEQRGGREDSFYKLVDGRLVKIEQDIQALVKEAQQKTPGLPYKEALQVAASERPGLFREREALRNMS